MGKKENCKEDFGVKKERCMHGFILLMSVTLFFLTTPITIYASPASQLKVAEGRSLLFTGGEFTTTDFVAANLKFNEAVVADPSDGEARFFLSITRIVALFDNALTYTPGSPIENMREFLDGLGVEGSGRNIFRWSARFSMDINDNLILPSDIPPLQEFHNYINTGILQEINSALTDLSFITSDFATTLTASEAGDEFDIEVDSGDVLLYETGLHTLKTFFLILLSYDININDADQFLTLLQSDLFNINTDLLDSYPNFLTILAANSSYIPLAKTTFLTAIDTYNQASTSIRAEIDIQDDDLIVLDIETQDSEANFRADLEEIRLSLANEVSFVSDDSLELDFNQFFNTSVNLRDHLPVFAYNPYTNKMLDIDICTVPDRTFSGILPNGLSDCWGKRDSFLLMVLPAIISGSQR